jgi:transposase
MHRNHQGIDMIGINALDKHKYATKVSLICDKIGIPLATKVYTANISDISTIDETLEMIPFDLPNECNLIGDKGYISELKKNEYMQYGINIITPYRKNQKNTNTEEGLKLLKKRKVVEICFKRIKQFRRIRYRDDRYIINFNSFYFLALVFQLYSV